jgi:outer membrane lipoprotein-sorting protein
MRIGRLSGLFVEVIMFSFLLLGLAQAAEYSAVMVSKAQGHQLKGKIYVKGENIRLDFSTPEGKSISILRGDKKVNWMILPGQKFFMEMPYSKEEFSKTMHWPQDKANLKPLGAEKLHGYDTEKYETTMDTGAGQKKVIIWVAKKLGVPIKMESADKSFTQDYQDIKEGGVSDKVFEIPAGYKKMTMPAGMPRSR